MRTLVLPVDIDDEANLTLALASGGAGAVLGVYEGEILSSYVRYRADTPELAHFVGVDFPGAARAKMLSIYERTNGGSLHHIRESLRRDCRRCPFCNISTACELDHYLSKTTYPCLAIFSGNLIPSCPECNKFKLRGTDGDFIHPYYDAFPEQPFLIAEVSLEPGLVSVTYGLDLAGIEIGLSSRIQRHFNHLDLTSRYSLEAQDRLSALRLSLPDTYQAGGAAAVRQDLTRKYAEAYLYGPNHWESALMTSLIACDAFCENGFSGI